MNKTDSVNKLLLFWSNVKTISVGHYLSKKKDYFLITTAKNLK